MATIQLSSVPGVTLTQKLQNAAANNTLYPAGTVFDCTLYRGAQTLTATVRVLRKGVKFIFGNINLSYTPTSGNMFEINAPNVTIEGVTRSTTEDSGTQGSTRFVMEPVSNSANVGYHVYTLPSSLVSWESSNSLTIKNCQFLGKRSVYTSSGGTAVYSVVGAGGIMITEGDPEQSSNISNVILDNVLVHSTRYHGITIFGGITSSITNCRVSNAAGHGFYITASTTSTKLDTCFASGNTLAGYCLHDTVYSTLINCASDSNGLGYWLRNATSCTLVSPGAEENLVRSSIPNNLGITLPSSDGTITLNDIGSDNVNFIKGTSYLLTGGGYNTITSPYSKNPSSRSGETVWLSKYTAHFHLAGECYRNTITSVRLVGDSPLKYNYRLASLGGEPPYANNIGAYIDSYDPINPSETPNGDSDEFIADVLDQGAGNIFPNGEFINSFTDIYINIFGDAAVCNVNKLVASSKFAVPSLPGVPDDPIDGEMYRDSGTGHLYYYTGSGWVTIGS
jgi:hypothetical protein